MRKKLLLIPLLIAAVSFGALRVTDIVHVPEAVTITALSDVIPKNVGSATPVTVAGDDDIILPAQVLGSYTRASIEVSNDAGGAVLTECKLQLQDCAACEWYTLLSGADWASTTNPYMEFCGPTAVDTLGAGLVTHIHVRLGNAYGVRMLASCGTSTDLTVRGTFK